MVALAWRLRVDLFGRPADPIEQAALVHSVRRRLQKHGPRLDVSVDAGTGIADRPVIGILFWVSASTAGAAADLGIAIATECCRDVLDLNAELYDVTVIPEHAVAAPNDSPYPAMPD